MGDIAEYYAEEYLRDYPARRYQRYKTEDVLNAKTWKDGNGTVHELESMERDHLQNVLYFLYKKRDRYWLNCRDASIIEKFENGDEFFELVIRKSTIWTSIIDILANQNVNGFNFEINIPGGSD